jgi:hypothetical protein
MQGMPSPKEAAPQIAVGKRERAPHIPPEITLNDCLIYIFSGFEQ